MKIFNNAYVKAVFGAGILMLFIITSQRAFLQSRSADVDSKNILQIGESSQFDTILGNDFGINPLPGNLGIITGGNLGKESEPNGTFGTADVLTGSSGRITGSLFSFDTPANAGVDTDFYSFTTTVANSRIYAATINATSANTDTILAVIASDGTTILESDDQDGGFGGSSSSIAGTTLATAGTYYLRVTNASLTAPVATYELYFAVKSGATTPETEPNNAGTPQVLPASRFVNGAIDPVADTDTFTFNANAGDTVFLSLDLDPERDVTNFNGRIGIGQFGTPANILVTSDAGTGDTIDSEAIVMTVDSTGSYLVYVDSQTAGQGGPTATYAFNVTVIPAATAGTCTTYTNATSTPIADLALTSSTINIPDSKIIRSLRVVTDITHANFPDLDVNLRSPAANDNGLFTDVGVATQTGPQNFNFDDAAALPLLFTVGNGAIFRPEAAYRLNWFNGENALGAWTLDIRDDTTANTGTLNSWSLEVCEEPALAGTLVYDQNFESSNGGYTHSGTADEWEYGTPATVATTAIASFLNCASGVSCWKTDLDNTYDISSIQDLVSPNINLTAFTGSLKLSWQARYQMESTSFDRIWVRVSEVGNPTNSRVVWNSDNQTMTNTVGSLAVSVPASAGWGRYDADISDFAGKNIQVTYHLESDTTVNFGGFAVDDVQIRNVGGGPTTAAISGRVTTSGGRGIMSAKLTISGGGITTPYSVLSTSFGYYTFNGLVTGQTYTVTVNSKRYTFTPNSQQVILNGNATANFTAAP